MPGTLDVTLDEQAAVTEVALALAARTGCPILCSSAVLDEAGLVLSPDGELREQAVESPGGAEAQVREFRDFLDHVDPDDFQS